MNEQNRVNYQTMTATNSLYTSSILDDRGALNQETILKAIIYEQPKTLNIFAIDT